MDASAKACLAGEPPVASPVVFSPLTPRVRKDAPRDVEEARKQAQQWLTELQGAKQEVARARAAEQEMRHRLLPDEQLVQAEKAQVDAAEP